MLLEKRARYILNDERWPLSNDIFMELPKTMCIKGLTKSHCMMIIKTWNNSWTTSARFHDDNPLKCILGCDENDCITHYIQCNPFWDRIYDGTEGRCIDLVKPPAEKLCLVNANLVDLKRLCIAFKCYHVLRKGHSQVVDRAQETGTFEPVCERFCELVRYYAVEHGLHAKRLCNLPQLDAHII